MTERALRELVRDARAAGAALSRLISFFAEF
jgi:hypothetical protein